jgi:hypothetical protein
MTRSAHSVKFSRGYYSRLKSRRGADHSKYILSALKTAKTSEDKWHIRHTLISELVRVGRLTDAETLLREDVAAEPDNPLPLMSLATHYHYSDRLREAKSWIARAVATAKRTRTLGYGTLGQQARIAISARDWQLLTSTLRNMITYRHKTGNVDCFPEADFLDRIPRGAVPERVIAAYKARRAYLSAIRYSTIQGRGRAGSNGSAVPTGEQRRGRARRR